MAQNLNDLVVGPLPGGFDPRRVPVWLWSRDGTRALWASRAALVVSGARTIADLTGQVFGNQMPAVRRIGELGEILTLAAPPRLERLRFFFGGRSETLTCLCKLVALHDGGTALLIAAFGMRVTVPESVEDEEPPAVEAARPAAAASEQAQPPAPAVAPSLPAAPKALPAMATAPVPPPWTTQSDKERKPVRFTWSSDGAGRLTQISGPFFTITGLASQAVLGRTWDQVLSASDSGEAETLAHFLSMTETWNAAEVNWPVPHSGMLLPIELSGIPMFDLERNFGGFRGFGILRLERVRRAASALAAVPEAALPVQPAPTVPAAEALAAAQGQHKKEHDKKEHDKKADENEETSGQKADDDEKADNVVAATGPDIDPEADVAFADHVPPVSLPAAAKHIEPRVEPDILELIDRGDDLPVPSGKNAAQGEPRGTEPTAKDPPAEDLPAKEPPAKEPPATRPPDVNTLATTVSARLGSPKVVPLRVSDGSPAPLGEGSSLTSAERMAFREIARALGAPVTGSPAKSDADGKPDGQTALEAPPASEPKSPAATAAAPPQPPAPSVSHSGTVVPLRPELPAAKNNANVAGIDQRERAAVVPPADPLFAAAPLLLDRLPIGVLILRGTEALYANRTLLDLTGYRDLDHFNREEGAAKLFQGRSGEQMQRASAVLTIASRTGESMPVDVRIQAIDWNGASATLMSFRRAKEMENAPAAASLEAELNASRRDVREARRILDTATDGVVTLDGRGRILGMNRSAEALFGFDQNDVAGERFTALLSPESHASANDYLEGLKSNGVASVLNDGREVMGRERKGGRLPLFMTIGRVSEPNEHKDDADLKFAAVVRDITHWKNAEAELTDAKREAEKANAQKSDFLTKISHEIRTPLNAIIGFAEVMMEERLGPVQNERYKEYLRDIHVSGGHVMSLVNDLLDLSKIEAGRMDLSFTSVDINEVVQGCIAIMQPQANRDRVIMRSHLAPRLPRVVADERSIRQIVLNLLSNASKFTEPGGQVIVSTALTDKGEAVIRVRDTGVGMNEKELETALEPFRRVQTAHPKAGTGLGLPLTKALAEANRAAFTIRSKPQEGTLIEVTFPATRVLAE